MQPDGRDGNPHVVSHRRRPSTAAARAVKRFEWLACLRLELALLRARITHSHFFSQQQHFPSLLPSPSAAPSSTPLQLLLAPDKDGRAATQTRHRRRRRVRKDVLADVGSFIPTQPLPAGGGTLSSSYLLTVSAQYSVFSKGTFPEVSPPVLLSPYKLHSTPPRSDVSPSSPTYFAAHA